MSMAGQKGHEALASKKLKKTLKPKRNSVILPVFEDGSCKKCGSNDTVNESIICNVCDGMFHSACRKKTGVQFPDSICTNTFRANVRPMIADQSRWGYFLFVCEDCISLVDDIRSSKNSSPPAPKSNPVMSHDNGDDEAPDILSKVEHLMRANNSALLESFREEMHSIIVDKLALCAPDSEHLQEEQVSNVNKENLQSRSSSALSSYSNFSEALVGGASSPQPRKVSANINQIGKESKEILVLDSPFPSADISSAPDVLSELLFDTRLIAMKTSLLDSHKKITLVFPSSSDRLKAKSLIENSDVMKLLGFHITLSQKALPKVTVSNIPSQIFETIDRSGLPAEDFRLQTKKALLDIIPLKNPGLKHLLDNEHFFEIVYINVGLRYTITAGIKVSPQIRNLLTGDGKVFILNSACPVKDRFIIKQCYNCQKLHHISQNCPEKATLVCMYCSGKHRTSDCHYKEVPSRHRCRNCSLSKDPRISSHCNTHHSSSEQCPIMQQALNRYKQNILTSKN